MKSAAVLRAQLLAPSGPHNLLQPAQKRDNGNSHLGIGFLHTRVQQTEL